MQINKKTMAAISAAVGLYLDMDAQLAASTPQEIRRAPEIPRAVLNPWAMAGRQGMMEMRRFYQMRLVR